MSTPTIRPQHDRTAIDAHALVAQLTLAAEWSHLDDTGRPDPARAAAAVLGLGEAAAARLRRDVRSVLAGSADLCWREQVGVVLHWALNHPATLGSAA